MKKVGFVYQTLNRINGKKYIGSHLGPENELFYDTNTDLIEDIKKYGIVNFETKVLEFVTDQAMLSPLENKYLREVDAKNNTQYYNRSNIASGRGLTCKTSTHRPLCGICSLRPAAVNCHRKDKIYYRYKCEHCIRLGKKKKPIKPKWQTAGYQKKTCCDRCGFIPQHHSQLGVYHIDGDTNNTNLRNLKTVCHNCMVMVTRLDLTWRRGDLEPDY